MADGINPTAATPVTADLAAFPPPHYPLLRANSAPRPNALPFHPRLETFLAIYASGAYSPLRAAQEAGWKGTLRGVMRRAQRILRYPAVKARLDELAAEQRASCRLMGPVELLGLTSKEARTPDEVAYKSWWTTGARSKAREHMLKHYGMLEDRVSIRELPKDSGGLLSALAHELSRTADGSYALPAAPSAGDSEVMPSAVAAPDATIPCAFASATPASVDSLTDATQHNQRVTPTMVDNIGYVTKATSKQRKPAPAGRKRRARHRRPAPRPKA